MFYIRTLGDPVLRKVCDPVTEETFYLSSVWSIFDEMVKLMRSSNGVGLAAPQIGVSRKFFIYEFNNKIDILINPEIIDKSPEVNYAWEGCLSILGEQFIVPRHNWIVVSGEDYYGDEIEMRVKGFTARVFQHEIEHLQGTLIIDYRQGSGVDNSELDTTLDR